MTSLRFAVALSIGGAFVLLALGASAQDAVRPSGTDPNAPVQGNPPRDGKADKARIVCDESRRRRDSNTSP